MRGLELARMTRHPGLRAVPLRAAGIMRQEWQAWRDIINERARLGLPVTREEMREAQAALARSPEAHILLKGSIADPLPA